MSVIAGITGKRGRAAARRLRKGATVRNPLKAAHGAQQGAEVLHGDLLRPALLSAALVGVDGASGLHPTPPAFPEARALGASLRAALAQMPTDPPCPMGAATDIGAEVARPLTSDWSGKRTIEPAWSEGRADQDRAVGGHTGRSQLRPEHPRHARYRVGAAHHHPRRPAESGERRPDDDLTPGRPSAPTRSPAPTQHHSQGGAS